MLAVINRGRCNHNLPITYHTHGCSTVMDHVISEQTEVIIQSKVTSNYGSVIITSYNYAASTSSATSIVMEQQPNDNQSSVDDHMTSVGDHMTHSSVDDHR